MFLHSILMSLAFRIQVQVGHSQIRKGGSPPLELTKLKYLSPLDHRTNLSCSEFICKLPIILHIDNQHISGFADFDRSEHIPESDSVRGVDRRRVQSFRRK